jgi:hypothetical protein
MAVRTFTAILHKEGDLYVAECLEVGTVSQGHHRHLLTIPIPNHLIHQLRC